MLLLEDTDVFLDFEAYYDTKYTLKKLSIEQYVRDPRFEAHMLAIAKAEDPVQVVAPEDIKATLERYRVADPNTRVFIQNGRYDAFVASQHYGIVIANPIALCVWNAGPACPVCAGNRSRPVRISGYG